jgi:hypothetical protein
VFNCFLANPPRHPRGLLSPSVVSKLRRFQVADHGIDDGSLVVGTQSEERYLENPHLAFLQVVCE